MSVKIKLLSFSKLPLILSAFPVWLFGARLGRNATRFSDVCRFCFFVFWGGVLYLQGILQILAINSNRLNSRQTPSGMWTLTEHGHEAETCHQQERWALWFYPIGEEFCNVLSNQSGSNAGGMGLMGWHRRTNGSGLRYVFQYRVESTSCRISAGKAVDYFSISLSSLLVTAKTSI